MRLNLESGEWHFDAVHSRLEFFLQDRDLGAKFAHALSGQSTGKAGPGRCFAASDC